MTKLIDVFRNFKNALKVSSDGETSRNLNEEHLHITYRYLYSLSNIIVSSISVGRFPMKRLTSLPRNNV